MLKEIHAVLEKDKNLRVHFANEIKNVLENYYNVFLDEELAKNIFKKIGSFFNLNWDDENTIFAALSKKDFPYMMYQADFISIETHVRLIMNWEGISIKNIQKKK